MFSLFKSEIIPFHDAGSETDPCYRQVKLHQFQKFSAALAACEMYNDKSDQKHYIINSSGKEYSEGVWIDCAEHSKSISKGNENEY